MLNLSSILSTRAYHKATYFHLVYEWEDELSRQLNLPIIGTHSIYRDLLLNKITDKITYRFSANARERLNNFVDAINPTKERQGYSFAFNMGVYTEPNFTTSARVIPMIIDIWKNIDFAKFYSTYKRCKLVLISSLEAYNFLQEINCSLPITHFPLSLPDKYRLTADTTYTKKYDILLAGRLNVRTNQVLRDYLVEFCQKYPDIEYLYQEEIYDELYYISNKRGNIGQFTTRESYINLLRESKISFYSTPGLDGGEARTGGFNPVTPRYLELLSAQCLLLGRYPKNEETDFYELSKVCPNIVSYEHFEGTMLSYLNQSAPSFDLHRQILDKHYTSQRAQLLMEITKTH